MNILEKLGAAFILGLIFVIGGGITAGCIYLAIEEEKTTKWPTVKGTVLEMKMETEKKGGKTWYRNKVKYEYTVEGKPYVGTHMGTSGDSFTRDQAKVQKNLKSYPKGKKVDVFYNPDDASDARLSTSEAFLFYALATFTGIGTLIVMIGMAWQMLR